jgi:hypothetical protein
MLWKQGSPLASHAEGGDEQLAAGSLAARQRRFPGAFAHLFIRQTAQACRLTPPFTCGGPSDRKERGPASSATTCYADTST